MTEYTLLQSLQESINDKGKFKAIFVTGVPGAGKSYTIANITDGQIPVRVVNSDKAYEFLGRKGATDITDASQWDKVSQQVKVTSTNMLVQYVNSMLPLFVDSTSSSPANLLRRKGILESMGYDCALVWIDTDVETAVKRAAGREREVPEDFIRKTHAEAERVGEYLMGQFDFRMKLNNNDGELTEEVIKRAYNSARSFFLGELQNPIGQRNLQEVAEAGEKNLSPTVYAIEDIQHIMQGWYKNSN